MSAYDPTAEPGVIRCEHCRLPIQRSDDGSRWGHVGPSGLSFQVLCGLIATPPARYRGQAPS